ncbi:hypothetical protein QBC39DRAFT_431288 [Podospora conica]|nr:hypothetical protein QBC39DRAFT_431288 [Schizothecium conicum]
MDQLHHDTFGIGHDEHDDVLLSQAKKLIQQCRCRRFQDSGVASPCLKCDALHAFSACRLELIASQKSREECPAVEAALSDEKVPNRWWDEDDSESDGNNSELKEITDCSRWPDENTGQSEDFFNTANTSDIDTELKEMPDWSQWRHESAEPSDDESNTIDTSDADADAETEQGAGYDVISLLSGPRFNSPALQRVWRRNATDLRQAGLLNFGQPYGRGTAHAVGLFANTDKPSIWLRLFYWTRRQREILWPSYVSLGHGSQVN